MRRQKNSLISSLRCTCSSPGCSRNASGPKPRFVKAEPPSDADITKVLQKISRRVIRKLHRLGYLESGIDATVATGYDPLLDNEPGLACTMAASVTHRIAFGERAGEKVRRIGSGFGYEGERPARKGPRCASVHGFSWHANTDIPAHRRDQLERLMHYTGRGAVSLERLTEDANGDLVCLLTRPWSDGTTGIKLSPLELLEKLAAIVPLPRAHLVRYAGCLAPHSTLREAIIPTPRQQGVDGEDTQTGTPYAPPRRVRHPSRGGSGLGRLRLADQHILCRAPQSEPVAAGGSDQAAQRHAV